MRQFQVPQFITVEDKVIGPLTVKQFVYLLAGTVIIVLARMFFISLFFFPIALAVGPFAVALAFLKINEVPFPVFIKNGFHYAMKPHVYIWKKDDEKKAKPKNADSKPDITINATPRLSESKLSDLAWSLNIKEKLRQPEKEQ